MQNIIAQIPWRQYLLVLGSLLAVFYFVLFFLLLRRKGASQSSNVTESEKLASGKQAKTVHSEFNEEVDGEQQLELDNTAQEDDRSPDNIQSNDAAFDHLESLAYKIEEVMKNGVGIDKTSLIVRLKEIIEGYPQLNRLPFKMAINNVIIKRSKQHCDIFISEEEANLLW